MSLDKRIRILKVASLAKKDLDIGARLVRKGIVGDRIVSRLIPETGSVMLPIPSRNFS